MQKDNTILWRRWWRRCRSDMKSTPRSATAESVYMMTWPVRLIRDDNSSATTRCTVADPLHSRWRACSALTPLRAHISLLGLCAKWGYDTRRIPSATRSPNPGPTTQPQAAINHYDAVSTFHDDHLCETRLPMLSIPSSLLLPSQTKCLLYCSVQRLRFVLMIFGAI